MKYIAEVGEQVVYNGKAANVLSHSAIFNGEPTLGLEAVEDPELTCTAKDADCITMDSWWHGTAKSKSGIQY